MGNLAKNIVSGSVAKRVVDGLEVIDVAHHDGSAALFAPRAMNFAQEQLDNDAAIPERGKKIVSSLEAHALASLDQTVFEIEDALSGT
jgi:hypothetical protein